MVFQRLMFRADRRLGVSVGGRFERGFFLLFLLLFLLLFFLGVGRAEAWHSLRVGGRCLQTQGSCNTTIGNAGGGGACCDPLSSGLTTCATQNPCQGGSAYKWPSLPLSWSLNLNNMPGKNGYQGKTTTEIEVALKKAWDAWTQPTCTVFSHRYAGQTTSPATASDRKVVAFLASTTDWANMRLPSSVLAVTQPVADGRGTLLDGDIIFNPQPSGRLWGMTPNVKSNEMDFADVAAHEIGHALGFGHTAPRSSLMYFSVRGVGPLFSGITSDEQDGICTIYPAQTCTTNASCGTCKVCTSGACGPKSLAASPSVCKGCTGDGSCGGETCAVIGGRSRCLQACDAEGCCPNGASCKPVSGKNLCVPDAQACPELACSTPGDCGSGEACLGGRCQKTCSQDSDCEAGLVCQNQGCVQAQPSKFGQPCSASVPCVAGVSCEATSKGQICTTSCGTGTGGFSSDAPGSSCVACPAGTGCLSVLGSQACVYPCSSTSACGAVGGGLCGQVNGSPAFCLCRGDSDCGSGYACNKAVFGRFGLGACAKRGGSTCPSGYQCDGTFCLPVSGSSCGNGICDGTETCGTCAQDCPCAGGQICQNGVCSLPATCGNGTCDGTETCDSCAQDCACQATQICTGGRCEENKPVCGNGICDGDEDCERCKADCLCPVGLVCKSGQCSPLTNCGDGRCEGGEACDSCPQDCACQGSQVCLSGACQSLVRDEGDQGEIARRDLESGPLGEEAPAKEVLPDQTPKESPQVTAEGPKAERSGEAGKAGGPCKAGDVCEGGAICVVDVDGVKVCLQPNDPGWRVRASGCTCESGSLGVSGSRSLSFLWLLGLVCAWGLLLLRRRRAV